MSSQTRLRSPRVLPDGLRFGKYQIVRLIGAGGMSEVYEAIHIGLRKRVALKILRPDFAENEEARKRFVSEGVNAARIRHTNIVDVTDVGMVYQLPFLVMALLEGEDLGALYDRQGRMPVSEVVDLLLPVAWAVAVGHEQGVVHRDLKPDNIFLHREGCRIIPKVLDFGVSRAMSGRRITLSASVFGTPHYMSPEQARGTNTDARTDQYALGVMLYEGVTGHLPRDSSNPLELLHSVAFDAFKPPTDHLELPEALVEVILRAMAHDPEERFPSMQELAAALVPFASETAREYWNLELNDGPKRPSLVMQPVARHTDFDQGGRDARESLIVLDAHAQLVPLKTTSLTAAEPSPEPVAVSLRPRKLSRFTWGMLAAALLLGAAGTYFIQHIGGGPGAVLMPVAGSGDTGFDVDIQVQPASAALFLDGQIVGAGRYKARLAKNGVQHELQASADGYTTERISFRDRPPPERIELSSTATALAVTPQVTEPLPSTPSPSVGSASPSRPRSSLKATTRSSASSSARTIDSPHVESKTAAPKVNVIDSARPRVRIVDELAPRVQVVE